ncbi:NAD(P)/FAD-dependent oxidoreductase [Mycetohabitans endofungorum]|uniref:NAD(P)/FAD-dependent oxidoreductase n=1 Tax=Mycetohabitans endofungorum TaxID=417203 RepID=UPI002B061EC7|nr:hypothetical protein [Mycetohabitans endofungorum]
MVHSLHHIEVVGHGVAAAACALLGRQQGFAVDFDRAVEPPGRIVSIPRATINFIEELTGIPITHSLPSCTVSTRRVAWESHDVSSTPFDALVLDAAALARKMASRVPAQPREVRGDATAHWTIVAQGRLSSASRITAGRRQAVGGWIAGLPGFVNTEIVIACTPKTWIFAAPHPAGGIALAAVYPPLCTTADVGDILREAVDFLYPGSGACVECSAAAGIPAAPSFEPGCAVPGRIAAGEAAISFDPLRGDGVGHAVRGALLAHSVITAIASGAAEAPYLTYYAARLSRAFAEHVRTCAAHYARAWNTAIWNCDIESMSACAARLTPADQLDFRLEGRSLVLA